MARFCPPPGHETRQFQHLGAGRQGSVSVHPLEAEREVATQENPCEAAGERSSGRPDPMHVVLLNPYKMTHLTDEETELQEASYLILSL